MIDAVVMLTWSNWHTEMRSNRYHYATRFAKLWPVIFVQPDLSDLKVYFEDAGYDNIYILHIPIVFNEYTSRLLNQALLARKIIKPMLWIYNVNFIDFVATKYAALKIYHATEDYFAKEFYLDGFGGGEIVKKLKKLLFFIDLLASVSEGVEESYCMNGLYKGEKILLGNGCDFEFYKPSARAISCVKENKKIAFYQGNITNKLNFDLLSKLINKMSDWEFWFCGKDHGLSDWKKLLKLNNVKYFGCVSPEEIRNLAYKSTVGLIPFVEKNLFLKQSFPLKAFEYVACGLPVVTVPIQSLLSYSNVFSFAQTVDEFEKKIRESVKIRDDKESIKQRLLEASKHGYDVKFEKILNTIKEIVNRQEKL